MMDSCDYGHRLTRTAPVLVGFYKRLVHLLLSTKCLNSAFFISPMFPFISPMLPFLSPESLSLLTLISLSKAFEGGRLCCWKVWPMCEATSSRRSSLTRHPGVFLVAPTSKKKKLLSIVEFHDVTRKNMLLIVEFHFVHSTSDAVVCIAIAVNEMKLGNEKHDVARAK